MAVLSRVSRSTRVCVGLLVIVLVCLGAAWQRGCGRQGQPDAQERDLDASTRQGTTDAVKHFRPHVR